MKFTKRFVSLLIVACLAASMIPAALAATPFVDVPNDAWYAQDVEKAYNTGLVNGKSATTYAPYDNLTYSEVIKLAACMHQRYTTGSVTLTNGNPWYQSYVDYCKGAGIISKDYNWDQPATRAGYMEIFANALPEEALAQMNTVADNSIPDVSMMHPQASAIYKLYRAGILQGNDAQHNCNPSASIKRSEVAAILTRMMDPAERIVFTMGEVTDEPEKEDDKKEDDKKEDNKKDEEEEEDKPVTPDPKPETPKPEDPKPPVSGDDIVMDDNDLGTNDLPIILG